MSSETSIKINLDNVKEGLELYIDSRRANSLFDKKESFSQNNEARYQLTEGCFYDYEFSETGFSFHDVGLTNFLIFFMSSTKLNILKRY